MKTTVVIPHHNKHDLLSRLLSNIDNSIFDIIIVSGGTFAENCNKGAKLSNGNIIFCNDDCYPSNEDLIRISDAIDNNIVGSTQISKKGNVYGGVIGYNRKLKYPYYPKLTTEKNVLFPSGFLFGMNRSTFNYLGGFNESYKNGYEDVDLFFKAIEYSIPFEILELKCST